MKLERNRKKILTVFSLFAVTCFFAGLGGKVFDVSASIFSDQKFSPTNSYRLPQIKNLKSQEIDPYDATTEINFGCRTPPFSRLRSGCWLSASSAPEESKVDKALRGRSQRGEDRYLFKKYFFMGEGGTFLEMGGLDGLRYSNSYFFESLFNWTGLIIEGSPTNFVKLVRNRPKAVNVNAMICSEKRNLHYIDEGAVGGAWEFMTPAFRKTFHRNVSEDTLKTIPTVPCMPLNTVLDRFSVRHVDLFSLDVEGAEVSVLRSIDFASFAASVILVEKRRGQETAQSLLERQGYVRQEDIGSNEIYLHPLFLESLRR